MTKRATPRQTSASVVFAVNKYVTLGAQSRATHG